MPHAEESGLKLPMCYVSEHDFELQIFLSVLPSAMIPCLIFYGDGDGVWDLVPGEQALY